MNDLQVIGGIFGITSEWALQKKFGNIPLPLDVRIASLTTILPEGFFVDEYMARVQNKNCSAALENLRKAIQTRYTDIGKPLIIATIYILATIYITIITFILTIKKNK